jgi:hypothetical protein
VLGTNPNPTESGSFGLRIRSAIGSESSSPDPGSEVRFSKLTNIVGKFCSTYYYFLAQLNFSLCLATCQSSRLPSCVYHFLSHSNLSALLPFLFVNLHFLLSNESHIVQNESLRAWIRIRANPVKSRIRIRIRLNLLI